MIIKVSVPPSFFGLTGNKTELECEADTIEELFNNLDFIYPGIVQVLCDEEGKIKDNYFLYLNGRIKKYLKNEKIFLNSGDKIQIIQLVAGG